MTNQYYDLQKGQQVSAPTPSSVPLDPEAKLSQELYEAYRAPRETWAQQVVDDAAFRNNNQFTDDQEDALAKKGHMAMPNNIIHSAVEQAKATICANSPKFHASGRDGSDIRMASIFADLMSYIWDRSNGNLELKQTVDDYYVKGMGVLCAYEDPNADFGKGEIVLKSLDPLHLYIDPNSQDILCRDAQHMLIVKVMTHEQIQKCYPQVLPYLNNAKTNETDELPRASTTGDEQRASANTLDRMHKRYRVIDRYSKILVKRRHVMDGRGEVERVFYDDDEFQAFLETPCFVEMTAQKDMTFFLTMDDIMKEKQLFDATDGLYHWSVDPRTGQQTQVPGGVDANPLDMQQGLEPIPGSEIVIQQITMKDAIELGALLVDEVYVDRVKRVFTVGDVVVVPPYILEVSEIPIVVFMNRHNRNPYPMSDVRFIRPIQMQVNKLMSLIIAHTASSTGNKLMIPKGSMDRMELLKEWEKAGPSVVEYDPELGTPIVSGPTPLAGDVFAVLNGAKQSAWDILGIYPMSQGDPGQAPATYKGTVAIDEYGQRRLKSKKDDIEAALNHLGRVVCQMIQRVYTQHKVIRLLRPNNEQKELVINGLYSDPTTGLVQKINDITVGEYDLVFVAGSTLPVNRWARLEYYLGLFDRGIIDNVEVLKQTEVVDMAGVLERVDKVSKLSQQLQAMDQKVQELEASLKTADSQVVQAKKQVEIEKFKADLAVMKAEAKKATALYGERLADEIALTKREGRQDNKFQRQMFGLMGDNINELLNPPDATSPSDAS